VAALPRAIELVAVWLETVLDDVAEGRVDPLELVVDAEVGHSLRATLDWSYSLLAPDAQAMWAVCAQFAGGFTAAAAESLCKRLGVSGHVLDMLAKLIHHSILTRVVGRDGRGRYQMLETDRQYGLQLTIVDRAAVATAHAEHYADWVQEAALQWCGPNEISWLQGLLTEGANLRAAFDHLIAQNDVRAMELVVNRVRSQGELMGGVINQLRRSLTIAIERFAAEPSPLLVSALSMAAWTALIQGRPEEGRTYLVRAREIINKQSYDPLPGGYAFAEASWLWSTETKPSTLRSVVPAFLAAAEHAHAPGDHAVVNMFAVMAAAFVGDDPDKTIRMAQDHLNEMRRHRAVWMASWALWTLALAEHQRGNAESALPLVQEAYSLQLSIRDQWGPTWSVWLAALVATGRGDHQVAAQLFGASAAMQQDFEVVITLPFLIAQQTWETRCRMFLGDRAFDLQAAVGAAYPQEKVTSLITGMSVTVEEDRSPTPGGLTEREYDVVRLAAAGLTNKEIGAQLHIGVRTVESHVSNALHKVGLPNRASLGAWLAQNQVS
jgi:non-specific serine/threonine protein kinase